MSNEMNDDSICTKFKNCMIRCSNNEKSGIFSKTLSEIFYQVYKYSEIINSSSFYTEADKDKKVYLTAEFFYDPKTSQLEISDFIVERKE